MYHLTCMQDEFYIREWPSLVGRRFAEVLLMFEHAMPLGIRSAAAGEVLLNPSDDYVLVEGERCQVS
jgi:Castor and Pollux, part of voltage-gated ion channel